MALQGEFYGSTSNPYVKPRITWSAVQSVQGNYSDVTATLSYSRTNTGYKTESSWHGGITVNGDTKKADVYEVRITYNSNTVVLSHTVRVCHENDGTKQVTVCAYGYLNNTTVSETNISQTVTLDTIPRAAKISATDANIGSVSTVSLTGLVSGYSAQVKVRFGTLPGYLTADGALAQSPVCLTASNIPFAVPTSFYQQIPNAPSGWGSMTCTTFYQGKQVGDAHSCTFTATASKALCAPVVSGTVEDSNSVSLALTGDKNKLVRYLSSAKCALSASAQNGASLVQRTIGGQVTEENTLTVPQISTGTVVFGAKDSRGYESQTAVTKSLIPYIPLTVNASAQRTDPISGNAVLKVWGNCFHGSFGAVTNTLQWGYRVNGGEEVTGSLTVREDHTYSAQATLSGLDYESQHGITVRVWDKATQVGPRTVILEKGIPAFEWGADSFAFHVPVEGITASMTGAAPDGYGLGEKVCPTISDLNAAQINGWYYYMGSWITVAGVGFQWALVHVTAHDQYHVRQLIYPAASNAVLLRCKTNKTWADGVKIHPLTAADVDAAPKYYGLCGHTLIPSGADLDSYVQIGEYTTGGNANTQTILNCPVAVASTLTVRNALGAGNHYVTTNWANFEQILRPYNQVGTSVRRLISTNGSGVTTYHPWEWVNPPMANGIEYRTTERWRGETVFAKLFDFGSLPGSGSTKSVSSGVTVNQLVQIRVICKNANGTFIPAPNTSELDAWYATSEQSVKIKNSSAESGTATVLLKYTK